MKRGQAAIEILVSVGVVFLVFLSFLLFFGEKNSELVKKMKGMDERNECFRMSSMLTEISSVGDGAIIISRTNHNISVSEGFILVNGNIGCILPGDIGEFNVTGDFRILNNNSVLSVENG